MHLRLKELPCVIRCSASAGDVVHTDTKKLRLETCLILIHFIKSK